MPDDKEAGRVLFRLAVRMKGRNILNLRVLGETYEIKEENDKLYGVICEKLENAENSKISFEFGTDREQVEARAVVMLQRWWRSKK